MKTIRLFSAAAFLVACGHETQPPANTAQTTATIGTPADAGRVDETKKYAIDRKAFNEAAFRLNVPIYWTYDKNVDGVIDADEVEPVLFYPTEGHWVENGKFNADFDRVFNDIKTAIAAPPPTDQRQKLVREELAQAATTLVFNDFKNLSDEEKTFIRHMLKTAKMIDDLYATQTGAKALADQLPKNDPASLAVFRRNWGPKCVAPKTEKIAECSAIEGAPKPVVTAYPAAAQKDPSFCSRLEKDPDEKKLLSPFTVVEFKPSDAKPSSDAWKAGLTTEPYTAVYKTQMDAISAELSAAANDIKDPKEAALKAYLVAASKSFTNNDWLGADEAWSKMNATNSKWYLRVAPDEVYWDPCAQKAGFHLAFARINPESLKWQDKLNPVETEMENTLAAHIGAPYKARKVTFHLPDFIDIVFNAGDSRMPNGATIGQSLPNWGKVAAEGRGRTVAMSNLYNDPDSLAARRKQAESLLSKETAAFYASSPESGLLSTILHEATHNLGPAHEYTYKGQTDAKAFGGGMAAMLEELKAQTGGLYYVEFLRKKGIITDEQAKRSYTDGIVWAFGHISRGMFTEAGKRKAYSQLAAIQVGFLMDEGAITWDANTAAANGTDKGAFTIHFDKIVPAVDKMMKVVGGIKASNDAKAANDLADKYAGKAEMKEIVSVVPHAVITERELRVPKPSFIYGIDL